MCDDHMLFQSPVRSRTLSRVDSTSSMPSSLAESLSLFSQSSGAYSENTPLVRDDVAKESDQNEIENLPAQGEQHIISKTIDICYFINLC